MVNWKNVENNMKSKYEQLDWNLINSNVEAALTSIRLDSLQKYYSDALVEFDKADAEAASHAKIRVTPLPDQSMEEIRRSGDELRRKVNAIKAMRNPKKVVRL